METNTAFENDSLAFESGTGGNSSEEKTAGETDQTKELGERV